MNIIVTGCFGFIGFNLCKFLCKNPKFKIKGIDNLESQSSKYKLESKKKILNKFKNFAFYKIDIVDYSKLKNRIDIKKNTTIVHLAAKAGVRDSSNEFEKFYLSNVLGFYNILKLSKYIKVKHLIYASSSSIYNQNTQTSSVEKLNSENQISFYAATKKSNEIFAHSFSSMYGIPTTGLRFFTVYGPYGRKDMAVYKFTNNISNKKTNILFNSGKNLRDFTYIDDVIFSIYKLINRPSNKKIPYQIFNIGTGNNHTIKKIVGLISKKLKLKAITKNYKSVKLDVKTTKANVSKLQKKIHFKPNTNIDEGLSKYVKWYKLNKK